MALLGNGLDPNLSANFLLRYQAKLKEEAEDVTYTNISDQAERVPNEKKGIF